MLAIKQKRYDAAKLLVRGGAEFDFNKEMGKKLRQVPQNKIEMIVEERKKYLKRQKERELSKSLSNDNLKPQSEKMPKSKSKSKDNIRVNIKRRDTMEGTTMLSNIRKGRHFGDDSILMRSNPDYPRELLKHESIKDKYKHRPKASSFNVPVHNAKNEKRVEIDTSSLKEIISLFAESPNKAIDALIEKEIVEDNCSAVARFLFVRDELDKMQLGLFLSEDNVWSSSILEGFVELLDFSNMEFDMALRRFLVKLKLPGEAQRIDRLMEKFAERYYFLNPDTGPFANQDAVYVLAFSVIMLNTDAHNPAIKKQNKMSKAQFLQNNSGLNGGADFPDKFLSDLYDKILTYEIKMESDDSEFLNAELKGYLTKQGGRIKTWKKRWFVLAGSCLLYFKSNMDKDPCGIIPLENLVVKPISTKRKFIFELKSTGDGPVKASSRKGRGFVIAHHDSYIFQASTLEEMNLWMESLTRNIYKNPFFQLLDTKKKKLEGDSNSKPSPSKNE